MGPRPFVVSRAEVFGGPCRTTSRHHPSPQAVPVRHPGVRSRDLAPRSVQDHRSHPDHQTIPGLFFHKSAVQAPPTSKAPTLLG